jgi:four helix bundle protein
MQKSNLKLQSGNAKFKQQFDRRLITFSITITKFTDRLRDAKVSWSITDQLVRSAPSIGANVIEAKASSSKREYI